MMTFKDLNIHNWIKDSIKKMGLNKLTPIQEKTIPMQLKGTNTIGVSFTGSGKSLAFIIPILNKIILNNDLQAIIIAPTRELARQIYSVIQLFKKQQPLLKQQLLIGGNEYSKQINNIKKTHPQIIVATVSRLKEAIVNNDLDLKKISSITIDEADMIMDLCFFKEIDFIFQNLNMDKIQKTAWSATLHEMLSIQLAKYYKNSKIVQIGQSIYENDKVKHQVIHCHDKTHALGILTKKINPYLCLIFANKKIEVETIFNFLKKNQFNVTMLHANLSPRERKNTYKQIKSLSFQYVVASDLASRGLDIDGVSHVISWNMPEDNEWYIHRAGRTGRGKYTGESWIISSNKDDDAKLIYFEKKDIEFKHFTIKNNKLVSTIHRYHKNKNPLDEQTKQQINNTIAKFNKKVKPGYKKKQKEAIKKIKAKAKRKYIDNKVKQELIKQYKIENSKKTKN